MQSLRAFALIAVTCAIAAHATKANAATPKNQCPSYLAFTAGNIWTYQKSSDPELTDAPPATSGRKAPKPVQPVRVIIEVTKVEPKADATVVTLSETVGELRRDTVHRCTSAGVEIDPQSFLFLGEPAGGINVELKNVKRQGVSFPGKRGFQTGKELILQLSADMERKPHVSIKIPTLKSKVQLVRKMTASKLEKPGVVTAQGTYPAIPVKFTLEGGASTEPELEKLTQLDATKEGTFWFAPKIGLVQVKNYWGHWYQLSSSNLK